MVFVLWLCIFFSSLFKQNDMWKYHKGEYHPNKVATTISNNHLLQSTTYLEYNKNNKLKGISSQRGISYKQIKGKKHHPTRLADQIYIVTESYNININLVMFAQAYDGLTFDRPPENSANEKSDLWLISWSFRNPFPVVLYWGFK